MGNSTKPMIRIHDLSTQEVIDREMTDEEYSRWQEQQKAFEAEQLEASKKAEEKAAILNRLGLTSEELSALLG